jgi:hypothetical protein
LDVHKWVTTFLNEDETAGTSGNTDPDLFGEIYEDAVVHCFQDTYMDRAGDTDLLAGFAPLLKDPKLYATNVFSPSDGFLHLDTVWTRLKIWTSTQCRFQEHAWVPSTPGKAPRMICDLNPFGTQHLAGLLAVAVSKSEER